MSYINNDNYLLLNRNQGIRSYTTINFVHKGISLLKFSTLAQNFFNITKERKAYLSRMYELFQSVTKFSQS